MWFKFYVCAEFRALAMERNKALKQATWVCKAFRFLIPVAILAGTIVLIHWHFDPGFYANVKVTEAGNIYWRGPKAGEAKFPGELSLSEFLPFTIYVLYLQGVVRFIVLFLIVSALERVIRSVKSLETFRTENSSLFRQIGKYFLFLFWISAFRFEARGDLSNMHTDITFDADLTPLILMLAAYVLAEIFKEGNKLYEEEQLTV